MQLHAYSTSRFLALIALSLLAGVLVIGGTESTFHYLYPTTPRPDFNITCCWPVNDGTLLVPSEPPYNSTYNSWITINSLNHFTGTISLHTSLSLPVALNPPVLMVTDDGRIQSSLTVTVPRGTPLGIYRGTITGTSGTLSESVSISVTVVSPPPDYTITASSSSIGIPTGTSTTVSIQLKSLNGFAGTVNLAPSVSPTGLPVYANPSTITLVSGAQATSTISLGPMPSTAPANGFTVTVNATGSGQDHSVTIRVLTAQSGPDFSITCCWPSYNGNITVASGSTYSSSAKLESLNNFTGTITLTVNLSLPATIYPSTFIFPAVGEVTATTEPTLTVSVPANTSPGLYIGNIEATSGSLVHFATLTVRVSPAPPDFGISASQSLLLVTAGSSNTSSIGLWSLYGFTGTVTLSTSTTPSLAPDSTLTLIPVNVTLSANGAASSILTIHANTTAQSGNYTVLVTASYHTSPTGPSVSHSLTVGVKITGKPSALSTTTSATATQPVAPVQGATRPSLIANSTSNTDPRNTIP